MATDVNESISSLVDGELDAQESRDLLDRLKDNSDYQAVWGRYFFIHQAIKRDLPVASTNELFSRIQAAIDSEPALLSPSPSQLHPDDDEQSNVVPLNSVDVAEPAKHYRKPMIGLAAAASVALVTILGVQFLSKESEVPTLNVNMPVASNQFAPVQNTQVVNLSSSRNVPVQAPVKAGQNDSPPLYAEQSIIDDGQWTRITRIGNLSLNGRFTGQPVESHVNMYIPGNAIPFVSAMPVDSTANQ